MAKLTGLLITFEGIDGCGKSTQARLLTAYLKKLHADVILLREPGGTAPSERIRRILLDPKLTITAPAELFLYEAARAQVTEELILPALRQGKVVICDRYFDSSTAYQGYGRGLGAQLVERLNRIATGGLNPDLTIVLDVDYDTALARRGKKADRLETEQKAFFDRVREGYKVLSGKRRVTLLDGRKTPEELFRLIREKVDTLLAQKRKRRERS
jgi:dTMP kinase